jgi:hypothetical protein
MSESRGTQAVEQSTEEASGFLFELVADIAESAVDAGLSCRGCSGCNLCQGPEEIVGRLPI